MLSPRGRFPDFSETVRKIGTASAPRVGRMQEGQEIGGGHRHIQTKNRSFQMFRGSFLMIRVLPMPR
jgi:hypothetical protein